MLDNKFPISGNARSEAWRRPKFLQLACTVFLRMQQCAGPASSPSAMASMSCSRHFLMNLVHSMHFLMFLMHVRSGVSSVSSGQSTACQSESSDTAMRKPKNAHPSGQGARKDEIRSGCGDSKAPPNPKPHNGHELLNSQIPTVSNHLPIHPSMYHYQFINQFNLCVQLSICLSFSLSVCPLR